MKLHTSYFLSLLLCFYYSPGWSLSFSQEANFQCWPKYDISKFTIFLCYCLAPLLYSFLQATTKPFLFYTFFFLWRLLFLFPVSCTELLFWKKKKKKPVLFVNQPRVRWDFNIYSKVLPIDFTNLWKPSFANHLNNEITDALSENSQYLMALIDCGILLRIPP